MKPLDLLAIASAAQKLGLEAELLDGGPSGLWLRVAPKGSYDYSLAYFEGGSFIFSTIQDEEISRLVTRAHTVTAVATELLAAGQEIAQEPVNSGVTHAESPRNAALVSAAPELLEALLGVSRWDAAAKARCWCEIPSMISRRGHDDGCEAARAAVVKARGGDGSAE